MRTAQSFIIPFHLLILALSNKRERGLIRMKREYLSLSIILLGIFTASIPNNLFSGSYKPFYSNWRITENIDEMTDKAILNMMAFASVDDQKGNLHGVLQTLFTKSPNESLFLNGDEKSGIMIVLRFVQGFGSEKSYIVPFKTFNSQQPLLIRIDKHKAFCPNPVIGDGLIKVSLAFLLDAENFMKLKHGKELRIQLNMDSGENLLTRFKLAGFEERINMLSKNTITKEQPVIKEWETGALIKK